MKKRILSLLLTICMVISLAPAIALPAAAIALPAAAIALPAAATEATTVTLDAPAITTGTSFNYPNLTVGGDSTITTATLSIENGTVAVDVTGTSHTVMYDRSSTTATVIFAPAQSITEAQAFLRAKAVFTATNAATAASVTITADGNTTTLPTTFSLTVGNSDDGLGGHYYMYVPFDTNAADKSWSAAYDSAKTWYYKGMKGYLVTITSAKEDAILDDITTEAA